MIFYNARRHPSNAAVKKAHGTMWKVLHEVKQILPRMSEVCYATGNKDDIAKYKTKCSSDT